MIQCSFKINNQKIKQYGTRPKLVNWSNNYLRLNFTFETSDWENMPRYIIFHDHKKSYLYPLENDCIIVPDQLLTGNRLRFTIYGEDDEQRITCEEQTLILHNSNYTNVTESLELDINTSDMFVLVTGKLDECITDINYAEGLLICQNNDGDVVDTIDIRDIVQTNHTHSMSDITDLEINAENITGFDNKVSNEIKKSYSTLENYIRSYYGA